MGRWPVRTQQCPSCTRYWRHLTCEAFPAGIPETILTGQTSHAQPYPGDRGKRYVRRASPPEGQPVEKGLAEAVNAVRDRDAVAYRRVKSALVRKGYVESDFEAGGPLYGRSVNELIDLARDREG